jgi:hypothetical protein
MGEDQGSERTVEERADAGTDALSHDTERTRGGARLIDH